MDMDMLGHMLVPSIWEAGITIGLLFLGIQAVRLELLFTRWINQPSQEAPFVEDQGECDKEGEEG